ncbi:MAG TPA: glycosyltransferase family 1 protein [Mariniphaga sp.]|nr:glycosyltransferase family 1 protein [Mariniphaga sp.]
MRIAINTRLLLKDRLEGIGWFMYETLKRITTTHPEHEFMFIFDRPYFDEFIFSDNITPVVIGPPARHPVLYYLWFEHRIPNILRKLKADLFLSPDGYLSMRSLVPQIAVIHDISFYHRPQDLPGMTSWYYNYFFPKFARKASRIATVSEYSKSDISKSYGIDASNIDVVYNGIKSGFKPAPIKQKESTRHKYTGGMPYFLYVGALHPRKNITGLLKAFERFKGLHKHPTKLLIVGGEMHKTSEIRQFFNTMTAREDVIFTGRVAESELQSIYGAALALIYIPFFEGFGIPIAEGMSSGIPVVCSNTTSMPEVGGEAVMYVDPNNTLQIAESMYLLATNENLQSKLISLGLKQAESFSWNKTSGLLWNCIEKVLLAPSV